jgi:RNA polymerase sigma factor (TIGR02999 family)
LQQAEASVESKDVSVLLDGLRNGDPAAKDKLIPLVYTQLRRLAHRQMAQERPGHTLEATALVNEVYLRLVGQQEVRVRNRAHFFALAAEMMRHILVDYARKRHRDKRGGGLQPVPLEEAMSVSAERAAELVDLDKALKRLAAVDSRKSRVVELRYFGGLSVEETAEVLEVSPVTVMRDWTAARAWLYRDIANASGR